MRHLQKNSILEWIRKKLVFASVNNVCRTWNPKILICASDFVDVVLCVWDGIQSSREKEELDELRRTRGLGILRRKEVEKKKWNRKPVQKKNRSVWQTWIDWERDSELWSRSHRGLFLQINPNVFCPFHGELWTIFSLNQSIKERARRYFCF